MPKQSANRDRLGAAPQKREPRAGSFDEKRARIAAIAASPGPSAVVDVRRFLGDRSGFVAGDAAEVAARLELRELVPDLVAALERLLQEGMAADKGCSGKRRILEALLRFEADARDVYLACLRYTQREPAWGEPIDTAAPLRGLAAHALVQIAAPDAVAAITPLLVDTEPTVRAEAAHALGRSGDATAAPVLHLKALVGDRELEVLQNAYGGLLRLDPRRYLPVVATAVAGGDDAAEAASLALGDSRLPEALDLLKDALVEAVTSKVTQALLMGIALVRSEAAIDLLIAQVQTGPEARAAAALAALALHRHDAKVVARAHEAVDARRGSRALAEALRVHLAS